MKIITIYFAFINLLSGFIFAYDKNAAIRGRRRIPERTLHLLEVLGGVFANLLLMYSLRHKNRKFSYWVWTWLVIIGWLSTVYIFLFVVN
jgi:uncharacterized membrane protein YsdA (DUF1294 family)